MKVRRHIRQNADGTRSIVRAHERADRAPDRNQVPLNPSELKGLDAFQANELNEPDHSEHTDVNESDGQISTERLVEHLSTNETPEECLDRYSLITNGRHIYSDLNRESFKKQLELSRNPKLPDPTGIVFPEEQWKALGGKLRRVHQRLIVDDPESFGAEYGYDLIDIKGVPIDNVVFCPRPRGSSKGFLKAKGDLIKVINIMGWTILENDLTNFMNGKNLFLLNGFSNPHEKVVSLRPGLSEMPKVCILAHEVGHVLDPRLDLDLVPLAEGDREYQENRKICEVVAELASYKILQQYGIDSGSDSRFYITSWLPSKLKPEVFSEIKSRVEQASKKLEVIIRTADNSAC